MSSVEQEVHEIKGEQAKMAQDISLIKQGMAYASKEKEDLAKVVDELRISVNRLTLALSKKDGIQEGKSTAFKTIWGLVGGIIVIWILWVTNSTVSNNQDIAFIKKDSEIKRKD